MGSSSFSGSRRWLSEPHVLSEGLSSLWSEWSYTRGWFGFGLKLSHKRGWVILEWGYRQGWFTLAESRISVIGFNWHPGSIIGASWYYGQG